MQCKRRLRIHLDTLLEKSNLSESEFCKKAGIQRAQLNSYRNNTITLIDKNVLARICCALNCTTGDLLEYVPDPEDE